MKRLEEWFIPALLCCVIFTIFGIGMPLAIELWRHALAEKQLRSILTARVAITQGGYMTVEKEEATMTEDVLHFTAADAQAIAKHIADNLPKYTRLEHFRWRMYGAIRRLADWVEPK